jgi:hypothetical protein
VLHEARRQPCRSTFDIAAASWSLGEAAQLHTGTPNMMTLPWEK